MMNKIKGLALGAVILLAPSMALGQTANIPNVITGTDSTGFPITAPVGTGSNGSVGMPVSEIPASSAANAISPVVSQGVSTLLGKASAGNLYTTYLTATADSWLMVFNSTSAPTNGATTAGTTSGNLQDCIKVPSGTTASIGGLSIPERFGTGIYFAISSTACATLTLATTGLIHGEVQ